MRNIKLEKNLIGPEWWPHIPVVEVEVDIKAKKLDLNLSVEEKEKILQGWEKVAVLKVEPKEASFKVGFIVENHIQILNSNVETSDGRFGMRLGSEKVKFIVVPNDLNKELKMALTNITDEKDEEYKDLPLY